MEFQFDHRIKSFILYSLINNHLTFYLSYLGMNYNNTIGFLLFIIFLLQLLSGILFPGLLNYHVPFNIAFLSYIFGNLYTNIGFTAYCDHYIISSFFSNSISHFIPYLPIINDGSILNAGASINSFIITKTSLFKFSCSFHPYYFCDRLIHNYKLDFYFFPQSFPLRAAIVNDKLIITPSYTLNNDYLTSYPFYFSDISPYPIFPLFIILLLLNPKIFI